MIKLIRNTCLTFIAVSLTACATPPRAVDAKIPLVEPNSFVSNESVPPSLWRILNDKQAYEFNHDAYLVKMSPPYYSALGTYCRKMDFWFEGAEVGQRVACANFSGANAFGKNNSQWFLTKALSNDTSVVSLR